ncbi:TetR/AcrR family transcriptional regulator [Zoogloea sp.]|uniref:TetR/AcrR family transcriptional regulator n=1 Tax=Zoogloea sp. TaxID=49181 RepID=UPI00261CF39D|nr:TetR/AcrR family transcriptional regulator [Zoogloea sp.]MDD3352089.1 TetR/AcrR family transcriptional regulator [Zoogloea sp.]
MPALVDHESRRQQIARIATTIICRVGLDAVTMRQIAAEAGFSTTIVTHYFANKKELLLYTYRSSALDAQARMGEVLALDPCDLQGSVEALLPLDPVRQGEWKVYFAFWQMALVDPDFAAEQRAQAENARAILRRVLEARVRAGCSPIALEAVDTVARRLLVQILGIAIHSLFDSRDWAENGQKAYLAEELAALGC